MSKRAPRSALESWIAPFLDGWFPRLEPATGYVCCGNETLRLINPQHGISVVATTPSRTLRFLDNRSLVWQRSTGPDTAQLWTCPIGDTLSVSSRPLDESLVCGNEFDAGRGRWSSWLSKGLRLAAGTLETAAYVETGVYGAASQLAGDWLVTARDIGGMRLEWYRWNPSQSRWIVSSESGSLPQYPQFWAKHPDGIVGVGYYGPAGVLSPGDGEAYDVTCTPWRVEGIPRVVDLGSVRYVLTASNYPTSDRPILLIRELGAAPDEVATVELPIGFAEFDCCQSPIDGRLLVAGGSALGELAILSINVSGLTLGLVVDPDETEPPIPPEPIPPDPIPPEPPMPAKPKGTIESYLPTVGTVPFKVKAKWKKEAGSGPIDSVEWLIGPNGGALAVDAKNPASDPDHTYELTTPGEFEIKARFIGPGGKVETGQKRIITADDDTEMIETVAFRTVNGFWFCAENGGGQEVNATRPGAPGIWESFIVEPLEDGPIALRSWNGQYLSADITTGSLMANRSSVGEWERFNLLEQSDGRYAIKGAHGYLWTVDGGGGGVSVNGDRIDDWSSFTLEKGIEAESLPEPIAPPLSGGLPTTEAALNWKSEFLAAPGFEMAFMFPGWSQEKQDQYLAWMRERGQTHLPFAAWGAYGSNPSFDFSGDRWPAFLELIDRVQAQGFVVAFFCITDQVWDGEGFSEEWAKSWLSAHLPDLVPRIRMFVNGWEFPQINANYSNWWTWNGDANHRLLKHIRSIVGSDRLVFCHFPPERITGWPHYQHDGGGGEPDWWHAAGGNLDGILWQDSPDKDEALVVSDCIGGPSAEGTTDVGDVNRIVGEPSTWDLRDKYFVAFEYSRDCARGERLSKEFSTEKKVSGFGNMGHWNGA